MADTKFSTLDPVSALDGTETVAVSKDVAGTLTTQRTTAQAIAALATGGSGTALGWFDVTDPAYGAVGDGVTDDTAAIQAAITAAATAGGGTVYFPAAVYIAAGALQDTSRGNAQILLPAVSTPDDEPITIVLRGAFPPPPNVSVIGATPTPDGQSVIKGTLNTGTGAVIGGWGPSGSFNNNTRIHLIIQDLTVRLPANPVLTAVDLSHVTTCQIDNLFIDTGSYYVQGLAEPTTATSYALRLPRNGNGADVKLGTVNVLGFYNGIEIAEHANGEQINAWGCKNAFTFIASDHASHFDRMMAVHCERVLVGTGLHYVDISQLNIEHAASGWWVTDFDVDDASNYLRGSLRWHVVLAGVGVDATFTVNGAQGMQVARIGLPFVPAVIEKTASHVATILDAGKFVEMNVASANSFTIPPNSSVPFPIGTEIHIMQTGAGQTALAAGSGVTISQPASQSWNLSEQYAAVTVKKVGTNSWRAMGLIG